MRARLALALFFAAVIAPADQTVVIGPGLSFNPPTVTIAPGEAVIWNWAAGPHSTTSDTTVGPEVWDSGVRFAGASFSHTFSAPGTYPYYCSVHSFPGGTGMNGVVRVVAPTATPTPTQTPTPVAPTPTPSPGPSVGIPILGRLGLAALLLGLAALGSLLVLRAR